MNNIFELYSLIFTDSLVSNLAVNFTREFAIDSAKIFGGYNSTLIILISSFAAFLAYGLDYIFGRILFNIFGRKENILPNANNKFFYILLLASIIPIIGKFMVVLAGFRRLNSPKVLAICGALKFCYYFAKVFT